MSKQNYIFLNIILVAAILIGLSLIYKRDYMNQSNALNNSSDLSSSNVESKTSVSSSSEQKSSNSKNTELILSPDTEFYTNPNFPDIKIPLKNEGWSYKIYENKSYNKYTQISADKGDVKIVMLRGDSEIEIRFSTSFFTDGGYPQVCHSEFKKLPNISRVKSVYENQQNEKEVWYYYKSMNFDTLDLISYEKINGDQVKFKDLNDVQKSKIECIEDNNSIIQTKSIIDGNEKVLGRIQLSYNKTSTNLNAADTIVNQIKF